MKGKENYFFNIYHRSINLSNETTEQLEPTKSHGHFYLSLEINNKHKFFGRYPASDEIINTLMGEAKIETDKEEKKHNNIIRLGEQDRKNYVFVKKIQLTYTQFEKALQYAQNNAELKNGEYIVGINDCTDFVQNVYNAAGLPLYFTSAFTREQLLGLDTLAADKVLLRYGSRETLKDNLKVYGVSREGVASKLNIDINKVKPISPPIDISLQAYDSMLPEFEVEIVDSDLLPQEKISGQERDNNEEGIIQLLNSEEKTAKIEKLKSTINELIKTHQQKLYDKSNQFIKAKIAETNKKNQEVREKAQAERSEDMRIRDEEFERVKARLTEELNTESKAKSAAIKAMLNLIHSKHKTPCGDKGTVVIDNLDILARKQQELQAYLDRFTNESKQALANINQKYLSTTDKNNEEAKSIISQYKKVVKNQEQYFNEYIKNLFEKCKKEINEDKKVEIEQVMEGLTYESEKSIYQATCAIDSIEKNIIVEAIFRIEYENPILNHPKLIYEMAKKFGPGIINQLIEFGMNFINTPEDKVALDEICKEESNIESFTVLMGLDYNN